MSSTGSSTLPKTKKTERATYAPRASRDIAAAVRWISQDNPDAARALRHALDRAAEHIARHPEVGRLRPEVTAKAYRFLSMTGFPYILAYDPRPTPPIIARILHGARDLPEVLRDL
ncbi:MAG: type II toxin-antitoxin system RelE/ParE family toxin [Pseudomonadota bacterium]